MSRRLPGMVIASVAVAQAIAFMLYQRPDWETQWGDQSGYLHLGEVLASTGRFTRFANTPQYVPEAIRTPVYPAFIAVLDLVAGPSHWVVAGAQAGLFALTCLLVYGIARMMTSERVAIAAGLAIALYPPLPYFGALALTEVLTTFLVTAGLALWLRALGRRSVGLAVACGGLFALTALTRPSFQYLPLFLATAAVLSRGDDRRLRWRVIFAMVAAFVAAVAPWLLYNVLYFKMLTFTPAGGPGRQLFEGTWQMELPGRIETELTALADSTPDRSALDDQARAVATRSQLPVEPMLRYVHQHQDIERIWTVPQDPWQRTTARIAADREYWRVGLENIRRNPGRHIWERATRGMILLWATEIPVRYSDINRLSPLTIRAIWLPQVVLLVLAAWGVVALARHGRHEEAWAIAALILYVTAVHVPLYAEARYSLPAKPMILLLATIAAADIWSRYGHSPDSAWRTVTS